jgi:hypothetical protein
MIDKSGSELTSDCVWLVAAVRPSKERPATVVWRVATVNPSEERPATVVWRVATVSPSEERPATAIWRVATVSLFRRETGNCDLACCGSESLRKRDRRLRFGVLRQ